MAFFMASVSDLDPESGSDPGGSEFFYHFVSEIRIRNFPDMIRNFPDRIRIFPDPIRIFLGSRDPDLAEYNDKIRIRKKFQLWRERFIVGL